LQEIDGLMVWTMVVSLHSGLDEAKSGSQVTCKCRRLGHSLLNEAERHGTIEWLRNCLKCDTEDGLSLSSHRRLLQTHPGLSLLPQTLHSLSGLTCMPDVLCAPPLTAPACSMQNSE
jgi:hypothetical protein